METTAAPEHPKVDICTIATSPVMRTANKETFEIYAVMLYEINKALEINDLQERSLKEVISKEYHIFQPLFGKVVLEILPPHRPYNHKIELQEEFTLLF
jgi:hypothetical protein